MTPRSLKMPVSALGLLLLSGCGDAGFPFGALPDQATQAELAGGAIMVQAPPGYCVDKQALRRAPRGDFALLARCDTLGIRGFFPGRRLALITVTTAPQEAGAPPPNLDDLVQSVAPATVIETGAAGDLPMVRLDMPGGPIEGIAPQHWRSAFALNGQLVGLALYAPEGDAAPEVDGPDLLSELARRTRRASLRTGEEPAAEDVKRDDASQDNATPETASADPEETATEPAPDTGTDGGTGKGEFISPFKLIGGLFD
ncbi:hypothetical protein [Antarcticimicrobium luteum]|uniref:Uncharacterized protein n=1 Tax=Antarcticimicrobium luteum TaxID=2547397 RepID=A0A4R5V4J6_9RHOB|nr:hypothetical protein [Antarcticimicrobium luteum]TDK46843.1 hypothetical protein E1832_12155 [Antarcticimicrobium luteum]